MIPNRTTFPEIVHEADFCVVGGGMAGYCAALAAARHGACVALVHDRPVLGGNASSEMRMHICGADRHGSLPGLRETGILEELRLDALRRNPQWSYSIWDTILYEKLRFEPGVILLLNASCMDATLDGSGIRQVTAWQTTTQTFQTVRAPLFADCSGDAVLAPLTGAEFRIGREARAEFGESLAPEAADARTMGMTCCFQSREHSTPQSFQPPAWARRYVHCDELPFGGKGHAWFEMGYWWVELGGEHDSIRDTELLRDELLKILYGVWDHIKNHCPNREKARNWALDWVQFLPAKRESRRYVGDHLLNQRDIESLGRFDDIVAYGGWTMDDHDPAGFRAVTLGRPATHWHPAPSPYGLPYRMLYSRNVDNLFVAGRCASATHIAMSSTRVMGTGCVMGQAIGTAAAMAAQRGLEPRGMLKHVRELQQALMRDDCWLPGLAQDMPELTRSARMEASQGNPEPVRDGIHRPVGQDLHGWVCSPGDWIAARFERLEKPRCVMLSFDSDIRALIAMSRHGAYQVLRAPPGALPRVFRLEAFRNGAWTPFARVEDNHQRLARIPVETEAEGVRWVLESTWGADRSTVFRFEVE